MSDQWRESAIAGVMRASLPTRADTRGAFQEVWRESWTRPLGVPPFVQANVSQSNIGVLRGLHLHLRQVDLWVVLEGRAHVCLVDLRESLSAGSSAPETMAEVLQHGDGVVIPEGVAHGFWALEPVTLLYLVTNEYDATDEHGFAWNDAEAGATWPEGQPILSGRDATAPSLSEALRRIAQGQSPER